MHLIEALKELDPFNDEHWTSDGAPLVEVVSRIYGEAVTRQQIINAAPHFSRESSSFIEEDSLPEDQAPLRDVPDNIQEFTPYLSRLKREFLPGLETSLVQTRENLAKEIRLNQEKLDYVKLALKYTQSRIKTELPDMSNQQAIQEYIQSQYELRAQKYEATVNILKGVDPAQLDPRAPIDRAMARKTQRGAARPTRA